MSLSHDLPIASPDLDLPDPKPTLPEGYSYGRHVALPNSANGTYIIRDADGASLLAELRPDLTLADCVEAPEDATDVAERFAAMLRSDLGPLRGDDGDDEEPLTDVTGCDC